MNSISALNPSAALQASAGIASEDVSKEQFLSLLVTQLQAQDPLEPVKNEAFLAQLATFSQLEEQQQTTATLNHLVALQEAQLALGGLAQGAALVGKEVSYYEPGSDNLRSGTVTRVLFDQTGVLVEVDGTLIPAGNIVQIGGGRGSPGSTPNPAPAPNPGTGGSQGGNGAGPSQGGFGTSGLAGASAIPRGALSPITNLNGFLQFPDATL